MKRRFLPILIVIVLLACLVACNFDTNAYKTLAIAKSSYETGMTALQKLQQDGKLPDADVAKILPVARIYYQSYLVADAAYEVYHKNPTVANQDQLIKLLVDVSAKLVELSNILLPYNIVLQQITIPQK